jgi:hypothetical protein
MTGHRTGWATRTASGVSAALLVAAALSGCTPAPPEIGAAAAKELHSSVLAVTQAAATGDIAGALADLNTLEAQLREATASGDVSADRNARIEASINLVRADLTAALPPSPASSPSPTTSKPTPKGGTGSNQTGPSDTPGKGDPGKKKGKDDK